MELAPTSPTQSTGTHLFLSDKLYKAKFYLKILSVNFCISQRLHLRLATNWDILREHFQQELSLLLRNKMNYIVAVLLAVLVAMVSSGPGKFF